MRNKRIIVCTVVLVLLISFFAESTNVLAASNPAKYGKYGNRQFYYTISNTKHVRVERSTKTLSKQDNLKKLLYGTVNIVCCFLDYRITVPYTVITGFAGSSSNVKVTNKSYSTYVFQFTYNTREIFSYSNDKKKTGKRVVLKDESGKADIFYEFHPVGTGWKKSTYSKKLKSGMKIKTNNYDNKSQNLKTANAYYNKKGCAVKKLQYLSLSDKVVKR